MLFHLQTRVCVLGPKPLQITRVVIYPIGPLPLHITCAMKQQEPPDMPGKARTAGDADPHVAAAAELWPKAPNLTVRPVMMAVGFHPYDASAIKWQRQINHRMPNIRQYHQPSSIALTMPVTAISSISDSMVDETKQLPAISKKKEAEPHCRTRCPCFQKGP